jgi:hypothetical protein
MRIEIQIYKDDGTLVNTTTADALQPTNWKTIIDQPIAEGEYRFFGWTYQPMVVRASKAGGF